MRISVASFLTRSYVDEVLEKSKRVGADPSISAFSEAVWALGRYASSLDESGRAARKLRHEAQQSLMMVLEFKRSVQNCSSSLLKLQVSLTPDCYHHS